MPKVERLFYNETTKKAFKGAKSFIKSELASRHRFEYMGKTEFRNWLDEFGQNPYVGENLYAYDANQALQQANKKIGDVICRNF